MDAIHENLEEEMATANVKSNKGKSVEKSIQTPGISKLGPNMAYLKEMARNLGMSNYSKLGKSDLIHAIQQAEGYLPCFDTGNHECRQIECLFRAACIV